MCLSGAQPPSLLWVGSVQRAHTCDLLAGDRFSGSRPGAGSLLIEAIWCKNAPRMVAMLLSRGVPVDAVDSMGCAALHNASARGNVSIVRSLLEKGAAVNRQCTHGSTALHHAATFGHAAVVKVLCEAGANPLSTREGGCTPLWMACMYGHPAAVAALLETPCQSFSPSEALHMADVQGIDALSAAARGGSVAVVQRLIQAGSPLNNNAMDGALATHQAAWCGHLDLVTHLLDKHAEAFPIGAVNAHGDTVLQIAACHGNLDLVKALLTRGANINDQNRDNFSPLHNAAWRRHTQVRCCCARSPSAVATHAPSRCCTSGCTAHSFVTQVALALIEAGADPNTGTSNRSTALHLASWNGDVPVVTALLQKGGAITARTRDGDTALHQAVC